jgi:hypothetical protein
MTQVIWDLTSVQIAELFRQVAAEAAYGIYHRWTPTMDDAQAKLVAKSLYEQIMQYPKDQPGRLTLTDDPNTGVTLLLTRPAT